ncbi:hypothetical protein PMAYCL1PPCAC_28131, partial [Pristionchus mayeri]
SSPLPATTSTRDSDSTMSSSRTGRSSTVSVGGPGKASTAGGRNDGATLDKTPLAFTATALAEATTPPTKSVSPPSTASASTQESGSPNVPTVSPSSNSEAVR